MIEEYEDKIQTKAIPKTKDKQISCSEFYQEQK